MIPGMSPVVERRFFDVVSLVGELGTTPGPARDVEEYCIALGVAIRSRPEEEALRVLAHVQKAAHQQFAREHPAREERL